MMNTLRIGWIGLLLVCVPFTHGVEPAVAKPAGINPTTLQAAEDERFKWVDKRYRPALLALDKTNRQLINAWGEAHQIRADMAMLELVWGTGTRRDAVKKQERLASDKQRVEREFQHLIERQMARSEKDLAVKRKNMETLAAWPSKSADRLDAARAEVTSCEDILTAISALDSSLSEYGKVQVEDRLTQIGIPPDSGDLRKDLPKYRSIIDSAFLVKDIKTDLAVLGTRQKEGTGWTRNDDVAMATLQSNLGREVKKLEQLISQEQIVLARDIAKLNNKIKKLNDAIEKKPDRSHSVERLMTEESELSSELLEAEAMVEIFKKLAQAKEPVVGDAPKGLNK